MAVGPRRPDPQLIRTPQELREATAIAGMQREALKQVFNSVSCEYNQCGQTVKEVLGLTTQMFSAAKSVEQLWGGKTYWEANGYSYLGKVAGKNKVGQPHFGDVVVMPWMGKDYGHVGIAMGDGTYISNFEGKIRIRRLEGPQTMVFRRRR